MDENVLQMAEALVQAEIDAGIKRANASLKVQPPDFDGLCIDCGEPIHEKRVSFGAVTCIMCQERREKQRALMRK